MVVKMLLTAPTTTVFDEIENYSAMDYDVCKRVFWRLCSHPTVGEDLLQLVVKHFPNLDFNYTDDVSDRSCLHEACAAGNVAMVRICVENGASRASKDIYGRKPIHYAAMNGHKDCLAVLLAAGTENVDSIDHDGYPPLLYAVIRGRTGCVRLLLDHHAVVDGCAIPELSPLSLACQSGHLEVATLLLERGARSIPNADGLLPLHIACREGHGLLAKLLIANGAQVNGVDRYNNWQPIFYAASEGHVDCVRVLLETGCQAATVDESKWTPYAYALWNGHVDVADLLDTVSSFARTGSEPKIEEMPPLSLDDNVAGDAELLPSLELPPPFIYGNNKSGGFVIRNVSDLV